MTTTSDTVSPSRMRSLIEEWDGSAVVSRFDRPTGTWIFIALHSHRLGPSSGGTRMCVYPTPEEGLADAMRLAEGMTFKWASIDLYNGGGKAVLAVPRPLDPGERRGLFERYGDLVESLRGAYSTGADLGTTYADMAVVRSRTRHVHGVSEDGRPTVDAGYFTALGVASGLRAALGQRFGDPSPRGRTILVQGLGDVGGALARILAEDGADLLVCDVDGERVARAVEEWGARPVSLADVVGTPCDVFAPCAVGGILDRASIASLACRIVAGSANNQLAEPADAERLHARGIVYCPDYVINAGAALVFGLVARGADDEEELARRVEGIGDSMAEILREAAERDESPVRAATRRVERILARGPRRE